MHYRVTCLLLASAVAGLAACTPSPYVNCVVAPQPGAFIGKRLKHDGSAQADAMLKESCIAKDRELDGGNGERSGRVRWAQCPRGPDCDETALD